MATFRAPKTKNFTVMYNHHLNNTALSLKAKGLMSLMLSLPEQWDYTTKGLARICKDGVDSIASALKELEQHGYLTRKRLRDANGRLGEIEYSIHEEPITAENSDCSSVSPKRDFPRQVNPGQEKPALENPAQLNTKETNTKKNKDTHPSIYAAGCPPGGMDRMEPYRCLIHENIEYDILVQRYEAERVDEIVELMLDAIHTTKPIVRAGGEDRPAEVVKSRLLKLTHDHIAYVFDSLDANDAKIHNIRAYLLTALYNAPTTMESALQADINHLLGGRKNE